MIREMHVIEVDSDICVAFIVGELGIAREKANSFYEKPIGLFIIF
jgi:hypothetical protein